MLKFFSNHVGQLSNIYNPLKNGIYINCSTRKNYISSDNKQDNNDNEQQTISSIPDNKESSSTSLDVANNIIREQNMFLNKTGSITFVVDYPLFPLSKYNLTLSETKLKVPLPTLLIK